MSDFTGETKDGTQGNIEELMRLFPQVVTETKDGNGRLVRSVDFAALRELLGDDTSENDERYDFTWAGKKEAMREAARPTRKTLRPCKEESKNWDTTRNLYIEGDNLEALKILENTYHGQVKMIYIDPPYNTGHDFIYHDSFGRSQKDENLLAGIVSEETGEQFAINPETNGRYHSDWCSMMYPRLVLARKLLRDDGVLFMSIDDNEVVNARKLCDEVFGEGNFIGCISRATGTTTGQDAGKIGSSLDYCIVYSKSDLFVLQGIGLDEEDLKRFTEADDKGKFSYLQLRKTGNADRREDRPNMFYPVLAPDGTEVYPFGPSMYLSRWRVARATYDALVQKDMIFWKKDEDRQLETIDGIKRSKWTPYVKYYAEGRTKQLSNLLLDIEGNKKASITLKELLGVKGVFDNPKPVEFIKVIQSATGGEWGSALVLDFFSGSATTAHAVMQLNAEDGGNRKFIMVQLPEVCTEDSEAAKAGYKNICEIGKERIRRAGEKISEELRVKNEEREKNKDLFDSSKSGQESASPLDVGFRVFKVSDSNMEDVFYSPNEVTQAMLPGMVNNVKEGRTGLDLLISTRLEWGLSIDCPIDEETVDGKTIFSVDGGQMLACFETGITDAFVKKLAMRKPQFAIFRDVDFKDSAAKINAREIFKAVCGKDAPTEVRFL